MIDTGLAGLDVQISHDHVLINDKVKLLKPQHVSTTQWESVWERLDKDYANNGDIEDGYIVVDLGKE